MLFCFLRLADVIAALVVIRILLQFIVQAVGLMVLRMRRPEMPRPFRMWLYPVPGAAGDWRVSLRSACAKEFHARNSICDCHPDRGPGHLLRSLVAEGGVAISIASAAQPERRVRVLCELESKDRYPLRR